MRSIDALFDEAASDRRRGASEIERRLVTGLLDARDGWTADDLIRGAERLRTGQPAMANLRNLARRIGGDDGAEVTRWLVHRAAVLERLEEKLASTALPWIEPARRVLTLSRSSAVASALIGAARHGWGGEIVVFDGSPAGGGAAQASRLAGVVDRVRSQPDATIPGWLSGDEIRVIVGADAVSDRRFVNVCGTRTLVELAAARRVPVVVVADTGKDLADTELDEVVELTPMVDDGSAERSWPLFESIPMDLVTTRISEGE